MELAGAVERWLGASRLRHGGAALAGLAGGFVALQLTASLAVVLLVTGAGGDLQALVADAEQLVRTYPGPIIVGNAAGLVALGVLALLLARMHTRDVGGFLRLRRMPWDLLGLGLAALVAFEPLILALGHLNQQLPLPEWADALERSQLELIAHVLRSDLSLPLMLATMALAPGLGEELLFRGYVQRQAERSLGAAGAIVAVGVVFGCYHLRLSQVLPLSALGVLMAYLAWRTGSLWAPVAVHVAHNGLTLLAAYVARTRFGVDPTAAASMPSEAPGAGVWALAALSLAAGAAVLALLHRRATARLAARPAEAASGTRARP